MKQGMLTIELKMLVKILAGHLQSVLLSLMVDLCYVEQPSFGTFNSDAVQIYLVDHLFRIDHHYLEVVMATRFRFCTLI